MAYSKPQVTIDLEEYQYLKNENNSKITVEEISDCYIEIIQAILNKSPFPTKVGNIEIIFDKRTINFKDSITFKKIN